MLFIYYIFDTKGTQYDYQKISLGRHCGEQCHTHNELWYYKKSIVTNAPCGGNGGNGGNGGDAGPAGTLTVSGTAGVIAINKRLSSVGGAGGIKGKCSFLCLMLTFSDALMLL